MDCQGIWGHDILDDFWLKDVVSLLSCYIWWQRTGWNEQWREKQAVSGNCRPKRELETVSVRFAFRWATSRVDASATATTWACTRLNGTLEINSWQSPSCSGCSRGWHRTSGLFLETDKDTLPPSVAWNSRRTCFAGQICQRLAEVQIRPCEVGLICSGGLGAQPPGAPANLRKLAVRNS